MSIFDTLLGNSTHANTNTNQSQGTSQLEDKNVNTSSVQNTNQTQTSNNVSNTGSNTNQSNTSAATGKNVTSSLDAGTIAQLQQLLPMLLSKNNAGVDQANNIATILQGNASKPAISAADVAGKESAAVTSFNQGEKVDINRLQNNIGSKNNTYSALVEQKGQQDLSSTLAGIVADTSAQNATIQNAQLQSAIQALTAGAGIGGQDIQNILGLVSALKGAVTTEDTSQGITGSTAQNTTSQTIAQLLEILNGSTQQNTSQQEQDASTGEITSSTNTAGKQGSGILGFLGL